ncbi:hypothetical protein C804_04212, partial [Lachnospiraceae bacterium A4]
RSINTLFEEYRYDENSNITEIVNKEQNCTVMNL